MNATTTAARNVTAGSGRAVHRTGDSGAYTLCGSEGRTPGSSRLRTADAEVTCKRCAGIIAVEAPAAPAVSAAEASREQVTVVVQATPEAAAAEDDDVMQCGIFGHDTNGTRCTVCGEPDPDAAIAADAALGTLTSEPGGFGAAIGGLGFGEGTREVGSWTSGPFWRFEHTSGLYRVVVFTDDGDRVLFIAWDPARPAAKIEAWRAEFSGTTPQSVVLAAIANALGELPVTR